MTTRSLWDETRALIEAGWHSGWGEPCNCGSICRLASRAGLPQNVYCRTRPNSPIDWDDIKRAEADADRMLYGGLGTPQRED